MKGRFLELVEQVKQKEIVRELSKSYNAEGLKEIWQEFLSENPILIEKIKEWAEEYKKSGKKEIFAEGESIRNPIEIAIIIFIMGNDYKGIECKIFARWEDLAEMACMYDNDFAQSVSYNIRRAHICNITAEEIFPKKENETGF